MPIDTSKPKDPILKRVMLRAGGASNLARELGISRVAVGKWRQVPAQRVRAVSKLTKISRRQLRPDLYGI